MASPARLEGEGMHLTLIPTEPATSPGQLLDKTTKPETAKKRAEGYQNRIEELTQGSGRNELENGRFRFGFWNMGRRLRIERHENLGHIHAERIIVYLSLGEPYFRRRVGIVTGLSELRELPGQKPLGQGEIADRFDQILGQAVHVFAAQATPPASSHEAAS